MNLNREILRLALPSILANIAVPLVGMVDVGIAGHLDGSTAVFIGAVAVGGMLFDLLYWNFGFLRAGTGGLVSQACGRGDYRECARILTRSLGIALASAVLLIAAQWLFLDLAFLFIKCSDEVRQLSEAYFHIRIWAAPATLSLMALKGWFIGMQDTVSAMTVDLTVEVVNILASLSLSFGFRLSGGRGAGIGFNGIAAGTLIAQYTGLLLAVAILFLKYRRKVFEGFTPGDAAASFKGGEMKKFFRVNGDLFARSLCMIAVYVGFTSISASFGDLMLSCSTIMLKLLMLFSYVTDGFAYAGEALTGRFIGMGDRNMVKKTVKYIFAWSLGLAAVFMAVYRWGGEPLLRLMTSDGEVVAACVAFMPWLLLMPPTGCAAFTWDGIFIGATASKELRNSTLLAALGFAAAWIAGKAFLDRSSIAPDMVPVLSVHMLLFAYFVHLAVRTVYLSATYRRSVLTRPFVVEQSLKG